MGTADGNTDDPASDRISDLALDFFGNCAVSGVGAATVTCHGTVTLIAQNNMPITAQGTVRLNDVNEPVADDPPFKCVVTTALCTITVQGPQTTPDHDVSLDETGNVLAANVDVFATRLGSVACGPEWGTANFTARYAMTPDNLTIDGTP
jgi:hypothetical protein